MDKASRWGLDGGEKLKSIDEMFNKADSDLFRKVVINPEHVLHVLLPPPTAHGHALRKRAHDFQIQRCGKPMRNNFIPRMIYKDAY